LYFRDVDEQELQKFCSEVAKWQVQAKEGETTLLDLPKSKRRCCFNLLY
jgi:hypothetical protein